ncbi:MAG: peptidase M15A [Candidatus Eisenbacteria bacterium]|uniref:Peptidase M15A n=1 Tax=Eiseniibacteriota bacterium TaxID=2212470 RepID=A0A948WCS3_UNCEI|nr:peptidase M15A [Candidatus Eisenbacteria bacterium]MBU1949075.1 peptidase M15A [Candidatus Eisenbacteria bacterium]MBU2691178.1 peptidase M15A [Candidatus Eisenbacteria bacterium]
MSRRPAISFVAFVAILCAPAPAPASQGSALPYETGRADFNLKFKGMKNPYNTFAIYLLPNELVSFDLDPKPRSAWRLEGDLTASCSKDFSLTWTAPKVPGLYHIRIHHPDVGDSMSLNVFVMVPSSNVKNGYLNGYRIGDYPKIPLKNLKIYEAPRGFIEVTQENEKTLVSPHFNIGQFLCHQEGGSPKYVVVKEKLVLKLELILRKTNEAGIHCGTFNIMSGYRTPYYNKSIGNVKYSRHVYGGAADIFIDADPLNGVMDDLNHDGEIDYRDAAVLYDIVDVLYGKPFYEHFLGGLARYRKTQNHGPFVHVDVRGFRARWGD